MKPHSVLLVIMLWTAMVRAEDTPQPAQAPAPFVPAPGTNAAVWKDVEKASHQPGPKDDEPPASYPREKPVSNNGCFGCQTAGSLDPGIGGAVLLLALARRRRRLS